MKLAKVYRFFDYNPNFFTTQYLWRADGDTELMSSARYIDKIFECMRVKDGRMVEIEPGILPRSSDDTLHVNMSRLQRTNQRLFCTTYNILTHFDDPDLMITDIDEWLAELENFVRGKIVNESY